MYWSEPYEYEGNTFLITKEGDLYFARCGQIVGSDESLENLKKQVIPQKVQAYIVFKMGLNK